MLIWVSDEGEVVPLPSQVAFWHPENNSVREPGTSGAQWLTCLKATEPGDRQVVWQGRNGGGMTALVDFSGHLRNDGGLYYGWACITTLEPMVPYETVATNPVLGPRLTGRGGRALQGKPVGLKEDEALEIFELTVLPPHLGPLADPDNVELSEELVRWGPLGGLDPERVIEAAVANQKQLWQALGFPEAPVQQQRLPSSRRPDLLAPGVVGETKRILRLHDGPAQIESYIDELDATRPQEGPWRGLLLQTVDQIDGHTADRIEKSRCDLEAWAITPTTRGRLRPTRLV